MVSLILMSFSSLSSFLLHFLRGVGWESLKTGPQVIAQCGVKLLILLPQPRTEIQAYVIIAGSSARASTVNY